MEILVTGATGFIGSSLVNRLKAEGHKVSVIVRNNLKIHDLDTINYDGSIESLIDGFSNRHFDVVYHLATFFVNKHTNQNLSKIIESNITFGCQILEVISQMKIKKFINTSTYAIEHEDDGHAQNFYAASKKAFEAFIDLYTSNFQLNSITLSLTDTYGLGDNRPKFINLALEAFKKKETFKMSEGKQEICLLYVDDVVDAFLQCLNEVNLNPSTHKHYSLFSEEIITLESLVELISKCVNYEIPIEKGFYPYRSREIMNWKPLYPILPNWKPKISLSEGINKMWAQI
jgi:CDP-paratose synthetase